MSTKNLGIFFNLFIVIALITAFYNAYQGWYYDNSSQLLLSISLLFSLLAASIKETIKRNAD
ncbi:hypothetical protein [Methanococcoides sp. NM1]|uniref:hypothetical protein n=1 Tax=Methanococcoides sp. NM1 TaxID=1201013 RepID=UPI0010843FE2|nr:hypothetical protein [Methanococcoides sp. NM1]